MMKRNSILALYENDRQKDGEHVLIKGWIRALRVSKAFGFIEVNDGSCFQSVQVVFEERNIENFEMVAKQNVGAAISVSGVIAYTPNMKQPFEIKAQKIDVEGVGSPTYPLQKKRHSFEYLRSLAHLRPRTNTFHAVFKVRSVLAQAIHSFFEKQNFVYVHTPIITTGDCEGAGEMFTVTTMDMDRIARTDEQKVDYSNDFFGTKTGLTVSGQLQLEAFCLAFGNVYSFGPTFRAENSNTPRHASEFWMIEPEIAFADLHDNMDLGEAMIKSLIASVLENAPQEIEFFSRFVDKGLLERLLHVKESTFERMTYTEAINRLKKADVAFEEAPQWGHDLMTEHERFITEKVCKKPVFVTDYPKEIKAFYMRRNDDGKTVAAMDLLVPGVGEIIGGSQREERLEPLERSMQEAGLDAKDYQWYLDLRRYGTAKHAGYGLGLERALMYMTGMSNIRDVIPFPRTPKSAEF